MSVSDANNDGVRGTDEGGKMKATGTDYWSSPNTGATNESGFNAYAGGYRGGSSGKIDYGCLIDILPHLKEKEEFQYYQFKETQCLIKERE